MSTQTSLARRRVDVHVEEDQRHYPLASNRSKSSTSALTDLPNRESFGTITAENSALRLLSSSSPGPFRPVVPYTKSILHSSEKTESQVGSGIE
jgi:hypothetical protein